MSEENSPITTTIKFGGDFTDPWTVLRAATPQQAALQLGALFPAAKEFADKGDYPGAVAAASRHAAGIWNGSAIAKFDQPAQSQAQAGYAANDPWSSPGAAFQAEANQAPAQSYGPGAVAPTATPTGGGETCAHGQMTYREGVSKAGKPYKAYFCPAPRGQQQCEARWIR